MRVDKSLECCPQECAFVKLRLDERFRTEKRYEKDWTDPGRVIEHRFWEVHCEHENVCSIRNVSKSE